MINFGGSIKDFGNVEILRKSVPGKRYPGMTVGEAGGACDSIRNPLTTEENGSDFASQLPSTTSAQCDIRPRQNLNSSATRAAI